MPIGVLLWVLSSYCFVYLVQKYKKRLSKTSEDRNILVTFALSYKITEQL